MDIKQDVNKVEHEVKQEVRQDVEETLHRPSFKEFPRTLLRGVGQVMFQDNMWTGILFLCGIIWGAWHWPLMCLTGYEYGMDYAGFPIVGMLLFCVFATAAGILCDWVYEKSGCIWFPAILHGAVNAAGTIPMALCIPNSGSAILLGPAPHGLLAGAPLFLLAAVLLLRSAKTKNS